MYCDSCGVPHHMNWHGFLSNPMEDFTIYPSTTSLSHQCQACESHDHDHQWTDYAMV